MLRDDDQSDIDPVSQLVFEMAQPLGLGEPIEVDCGTIENACNELNDIRGEIAMSLHEKCGALIGVLKSQYSIDAEYSMLGRKVRFVPIR